MTRGISNLEDGQFDLLIVGAGITGAFLALDASVRGMSVAVIDKGDFGAATSSASSKLLHGGIRYLQHGQLLKVRESALERAYFQVMAPHLTRYVPFVIPAYRGIRKNGVLLRSAVAVYDVLCWGQNRFIEDASKKVPSGRRVSRAEIQELLPWLRSNEVTGGVLLHESHMYSSERMTLAVLDTAARHGAILANYVRAGSFLKTGQQLHGVSAKDLLTGRDLEIKASMVANAAGPWISELLDNQPHNKNIIRALAKGTHIVTKALTKRHAIAFATRQKTQGYITRGGRHIFIIPWRDHSLIGTTYTPFTGDLNAVHPSEDEITDLKETINDVFGSCVLKRSDIVHAYSGLYPLTQGTIHLDVYQGIGTYQIVDHQTRDGLMGLVSVLGAKYTTARLLAEKAVNLIAAKSARPFRPCQTRTMALAAGEITDLESYRRDKSGQYADFVTKTAVEQLVANYGTGIDGVLEVAKRDPRLRKPLSDGVLAAEAVYAAEQEVACHLADFVFRRTGLGTLGNPGQEVIAHCADLMCDVLRWTEERRNREVEDTMARFIS